MSRRAVAIASIYDNAALAPHFVRHYAALGFERVLVLVREPEPGPMLADVEAAVRGYPARAVWRRAVAFADSDRALVEDELLREEGIEPDDWIAYADLDEFHEYPRSLAEIVDTMNRDDDWALRGWTIDRLAEDGRLAPIRPTPSIGEQFPLACDVSGVVLRAWRQKIVLCRYRVQLEGGVRHDTLNARYDRVPFGDPADYRVHHFKWTAGLPQRIERRLAEFVGPRYRSECETLLEHLRRHGGIDVGAPGLQIERLGALRILHTGSVSRR